MEKDQEPNQTQVPVESKEPVICSICRNPDLIFTCFCYKCKKTFPTGTNCVITCPDDPECENANEILYGQWTRTTYFCSKCNANHLFYDGCVIYYFITPPLDDNDTSST
jgi:hypothetical protein